MRKLTVILASVCLVATALFVLIFPGEKPPKSKFDRIKEQKIARMDRLIPMLMDPATGKIPKNVRNKELNFSGKMPKPTGLAKTENEIGYEWAELGPSNVGGRVRAIALDSRNSDIVIVGAASGGIWRSANGGTSWTAVLPEGSNLAISSIAQDAVSPDIWYASTGEIDGGSAFARDEGFDFYGGNGLYKSIDNGQTWSLQTYTFDGSDYVVSDVASATTPNANSSPFVLTIKLLSHDFNGTPALFLASQFWGLWLSTDNGDSFSRFIELNEDPEFSDIVIDDSNVITIYSSPTSSDNDPFGFFRSYDGGDEFLDITPAGFSTATNARSVLALAPSSQGIIYAFTHLGNDESSLLKFDFTDFDGGNAEGPTIVDHSDRLPTYPESIFTGADGNPEPAEFTTQRGYDMTVAVHPNDPDFVLLGYVELIRSDDDFTTDLTDDPGYTWIGGNDNPTLRDEDPAIVFSDDFKHHADQHVVLFDPANPNVVWSGHDGGLSKTADITANRVAWTSMNNDFNVTQYYHISVAGTDLVGGTQDNGTPYLDFEDFDGTTLISSSFDLSSGDGSYSFLGGNLGYVSSQTGNISVIDFEEGEYINFISRSDLSPRFIHPFTVDPSDAKVLFYPAGDGSGIIERNNDARVDSNTDWTELDLGNGLLITALKVSRAAPQSRLYVGGFDTDDGNQAKLMVLDNATTATSEDFVSFDVPGIPATAWLSDIGINPVNANEILLVYSNYNISGIVYSADGGNTFSLVEGNLSGADDQGDSFITGPSIRSAEIVELENGVKKYFVGTSIGVFSTTSLEGENTVWTSEFTGLDNVIVADLDQRVEDHAIFAGTHGRGIFAAAVSDVPEFPNLTFNSLTAVNQDNETDFEVGDVITLTATFTNTGTVPVNSAFAVSFARDDSELGSAAYDNVIQPDASATVSFTLEQAEATEGTYSFSTLLDAEEVIRETDETDNSGNLSVDVIQPLPNLTVRSFSVSVPGSDIIEVGSAVEFSIEIENNGAAATAGSFVVDFVGTNYSVSGTVSDPIAAGDTDVFTLTGDPFPAVGDIEVTATVDVNEEIAEEDETDNSASNTITISEVVLNTALSQHELHLYPNPVIHDELFIESDQGDLDEVYESLQFFTLSGQRVAIDKSMTGTGISVVFRSVENGTYIMTYQLEDQLLSKRLLIGK